MIELEKSYDASQVEDRIYKQWLDSGYFNPDNLEGTPYSIVLPPPNVTGTLHIGHALMVVIQDILIRYKRMNGFKTLWLPGTDHAAIATQSKVEKILEKEGVRKNDLGRDEFLKRVESFAQESHDTIVGQIKAMGASIDWSREAYTLDETRSKTVRAAFKIMYDAGLIYRGSRIVNWDPKLQTTVSDDEIEWKEQNTPFYYLKYGPFTIATARPETKFGDKYVVMHPEDARYKQYEHNQKIELEWINGPITATVIKDEAIDMEFGTGVMTITPWHDLTDFEIAQRHSLDKEQIIDERGKLLEIAGEFAGMKITEARTKIVEKLQAKGLVEKIDENYANRIATNSRGGGTIEPQIKEQWFMDVNREFAMPHSELTGINEGDLVTLKHLMRHVVESGQIKIAPEHFSKIYFHWIDNLRDWCISRQIWYGHRIPVWYDQYNTPHLPHELTVLLARHGQSEANANKIIAGTIDSPLTEEGEKQATKLGMRLKNEGRIISKIVCSELSRSKETARLVAAVLGLSHDSIEIWPEMKEVDFGSLSGQSTEHLDSPFKRAQESDTGETLEQIEVRAHAVVKRLKLEQDDKNILIIGHNTFNKAIEATLAGHGKETYINYRQRLGSTQTGDFIELHFLNDLSGPNLTQDSDTLDTWFSSGLWTFSTLANSPQEIKIENGRIKIDSKDFLEFHPTDVIETGYDILFFWVARMVLMSTYHTGQIPFKNVYLHGLVRDATKEKMSKSKGNVIDPLDMIDKYGTDAMRFALIFNTAAGTDMALAEDKIKGMKHFANKLWNIARYILSNVESTGLRVKGKDTESYTLPPQPSTDADKNILSKLEAVKKEVSTNIENFQLHLAAQALYQFTWYELADIYIEASKAQLQNDDQKENTQAILLYSLFTILKLLHPFMPFVTEEIWSKLDQEKLLLVTNWPK